MIHKTSILQRSDVHPNLAPQNYCPIYRKRSTSKFMRTICCQAPRYSLDNVSKMLPPMNALDSYFGKWNGTKMWPIKSISLDTNQRIFIKLVQQSCIIILFLLVVVVVVVANHRTRYIRTKFALMLQSSSHLGDTNTMIDTNVSGAICTADLHRINGALQHPNHVACWQEPLCVLSVRQWLLLFPLSKWVSVFLTLHGQHADPS